MGDNVEKSVFKHAESAKEYLLFAYSSLIKAAEIKKGKDFNNDHRKRLLNKAINVLDIYEDI